MSAKPRALPYLGGLCQPPAIGGSTLRRRLLTVDQDASLNAQIGNAAADLVLELGGLVLVEGSSGIASTHCGVVVANTAWRDSWTRLHTKAANLMVTQDSPSDRTTEVRCLNKDINC